jgi:hypothetical protein
MWENPKRVEAAIKRLTREIEEIDTFFYKVNEDDERHLHAGMLERKRDDIVRSAVLQIHTAIEDILDQHITFAITGGTRRRHVRGHSARALRTILTGSRSIGFDSKLALALALRVITPKTRDRLQVLNTLRNKCSHNWVLKVPVRHGKRPAQKKPPLLLYEGRDLHTVAALEDFTKEFGGGIYLKLYLKYLDFA